MKTENTKKQIELYIHIPFCMRKCAYCDFLSFATDEKTQEAYVRALISEMRYYGAKMKDYEVTTVYVGGGTPSWLSEELLAAVLDAAGEAFCVRPDAEVTVECNPGTLTEKKLDVYRRAGVNRLSIGLQSTDNEELKLLGRVHTFEQFLKSYEMARRAGFDNINIDLMSGLPNQTIENYLRSLLRVIRLKPEHISAYSLIIEKGTPFYDTYKFDVVKQEAGMKPDVLPDENDVYRMQKITQCELKEAGYLQYEISNFAKPGHECRHNVGYWTRENYLGVGLGAASLLAEVRYSNTRDLYAYIEGADHLCDRAYREWHESEKGYSGEWLGTSLHASADPILKKARMEEFMFLGLRMTEGVARARFEECFSMPVEAVYRDAIEKLKRERLLVVKEGRVMLTDRGRDVSNYAMAQFLL